MARKQTSPSDQPANPQAVNASRSTAVDPTQPHSMDLPLNLRGKAVLPEKKVDAVRNLRKKKQNEDEQQAEHEQDVVLEDAELDDADLAASGDLPAFESPSEPSALAQLAQLELPEGTSASTGLSSTSMSSASFSFGSLAGGFGLAAGLGLAVGGSGGKSSAGAASAVIPDTPDPDGLTPAPIPSEAPGTVISIFSDSYTNVNVSNFGPVWGDWQTSRVAETDDGSMLHFTNVNVQGIQIADPVSNAGAIDATGKTSLHMHIWMEAAGQVDFLLVSPGPVEAAVTLSGQAGWNSFNIDLKAFGGVNLSTITQAIFRTVVNGVPLFDNPATDFYLDNLYFNDSAPNTGTPNVELEGLLVNGYIKDALIFQDLDGDGELDNDQDGVDEPGEEPFAFTDQFGRFVLEGYVENGGALIALPTPDTKDTSTGLSVSNTFKAPSGASVISPISTLIEAGATEAQLRAAFGLDADVDLLNFNPVQAIEDAVGGNDLAAANIALKLKAVNVMISNLMDVGTSLIQGAVGGTEDFSAAVVSRLVQEIQGAAGAIDLTDTHLVGSILEDAATAKGATTGTLAAVIEAAADQLAASVGILNTQSVATVVTNATVQLETMAKTEKVIQSSVSESVKKAVLKGDEVVGDLSGINLAQEIEDALVNQEIFQTLGFEDSENVSTTAFNGAIVSKEVFSDNTVIKVIKPSGTADESNASGVTVSTGNVGELKTVFPLDLVSKSEMGMWVHSIRAGTTVTLEVGDSKSGGYPQDANWVATRAVTTKAGWEYLKFDFDAPIERYVANGNSVTAQLKTTEIQSGVTYDMLSVFFDLGQAKGTDQTYYFDKLGVYTDNPGAAPPDIDFDSAVAIPDGYSLVWGDEFGGDITTDDESKEAIDSQIWFAETGRGPNNDGWGNSESQTYTGSLDNVYVQNGALNIVANRSGGSISSARLKSIPDVGPDSYVEVRAKVPVSQGSWPAIWLLGQGQWPNTGEIDIMEWSSAFFEKNEVQAALHFNDSHGDTDEKASVTLSTTADEFQTYQLWWTQDAIRIGVNADSGNAYYVYERPDDANADNWPFTNPMDMILNLAIGGTLGGTVPDTNFTYQMVVDYVRVYSAGNTPTSPQEAAPAPTEDSAAVISLFSDTYTNVSVADFAPVWGDWQTSRVTETDDGSMLHFTNVNVQGIQIADPETNAGAIDATGKTSLHMHMWMAQAGSVEFLLISKETPDATPAEAAVTLSGQAGWNSFNIDLTAFTGVDLSTITQAMFRTVNNGAPLFDNPATNFYLDNVYLNNSAPNVELPAEPLEVVNNFNSADGVIAFEGAQTSLIAEEDAPTGAVGSVIQSIKPIGAQPWAGATIATLLEGEFIATGNTEVSLRIWSPEAGKTVRLKLEDANDNTKTVETDVLTTVADDWQTLVFDFSQHATGTSAFNNDVTYNKANVFFDFLAEANDQTYYFDDLSYTLFPV